MTPTLFTSCNALHLAGRTSPEASLLPPVLTCEGGLGAAGVSPEGALFSLGRPDGKIYLPGEKF